MTLRFRQKCLRNSFAGRSRDARMRVNSRSKTFTVVSIASAVSRPPGSGRITLLNRLPPTLDAPRRPKMTTAGRRSILTATDVG